jgi:hypothetical protein
MFLRRYSEPEVSIELKFQILDCLNRFWGTVFTLNSEDLIVAAKIILPMDMGGSGWLW